MSEELNLVSQLAIILISASVFTIISKALKQPVILGYIIAGFIVGPNLGIFPQFSPESVTQWSELGIIFLLFGLGLEFSFKKLLNVGSAAIIAALTICAGMFILGYITGTLLNWSSTECLFLGGMLSMSSTTIIIKAYDDLGLKNAKHAPLVFGLLVVEDLLAVLMMVLFSTIAVSNNFSGVSLLTSLAKLVGFLVLCFLVGIFVLPSLLKKSRSYISDEILVLISVGLCFLMVTLANLSGFSSALGAFLMGSILSSTIEGERIEHITSNIKNLFGAIFFVSVGMMVDLAVIAQYWPLILVLTVVAMVGILIFSTSGVLLAGKNLDTALHVGFSLPQLGEFSFIIASLGVSLGALRDFIYPVIIAVSVITTFTTPYMIKAAEPVSRWLHKKLPAKAKEKLCNREQPEGERSEVEVSHWKQYFKKYFLRVGLYGIILVAIMLGIRAYLPQLTTMVFPEAGKNVKTAIEIVFSLLVMSPFLYGLAVNGSDLKVIANALISKAPRSKVVIVASIYFRIFLAIEFAVATILVFVKLSGLNIILLVLSLVVIFLLARRASFRFTTIEDRFFQNLNAKDVHNRNQTPVTSMVRSRLSGYDVHIEPTTVSPDFRYAGMTLRDMPFRHASGVNILKIQRGSKAIIVPSGTEPVYPGDILLAVGSTEQIKAFKEIMDANTVESKTVQEEFNVEPVTLIPESELTGMELKDTGMRNSGCMVISVERDGILYTNPNKDFKFEAGDIVWLAGIQSSLDWYKATKVSGVQE